MKLFAKYSRHGGSILFGGRRHTMILERSREWHSVPLLCRCDTQELFDLRPRRKQHSSKEGEGMLGSEAGGYEPKLFECLMIKALLALILFRKKKQ